MTQREQVLEMLKAAGPKGVRSDTFIANFMPRAAARVQELKGEGYEISSEREGKYVCWTLTNVGSSTKGRDQASPSRAKPVDATLGAASGVADSVTPLPEAHARTTSMYETWVDEAA